MRGTRSLPERASLLPRTQAAAREASPAREVPPAGVGRGVLSPGDGGLRGAPVQEGWGGEGDTSMTILHLYSCANNPDHDLVFPTFLSSSKFHSDI